MTEFKPKRGERVLLDAQVRGRAENGRAKLAIPGIALTGSQWLGDFDDKGIHPHPGVDVAALLEECEAAKEEVTNLISAPQHRNPIPRCDRYYRLRTAREAANAKHAPADHEWKVTTRMADGVSVKLGCACGAHMWQPTRSGAEETDRGADPPEAPMKEPHWKTLCADVCRSEWQPTQVSRIVDLMAEWVEAGQPGGRGQIKWPWDASYDESDGDNA